MYEHYYIIDFDEGYVYSFKDGNDNNDCQKLKIDSGNLKKELVLTYNGGKTKWDNKLYFQLEDNADFLLLEDKDGAKGYFVGTDLNKALELKDSKNIKDYVNKTKDKAEKNQTQQIILPILKMLLTKVSKTFIRIQHTVLLITNII